jgi:hypothetical protein
MSTRIYTVTEKGYSIPRLVEASSQSQAIRHVVADRFEAAAASGKDVAAAMQAGAMVETAGVDPEDLVS